MKRVGVALALVSGLTLLPVPSSAGVTVVVRGGALRVTSTGHAALAVAAGALAVAAGSALEPAGLPGPTYLIVDATPSEAQVFLDGRLLGTAQQLVARALLLTPGSHAVEVVAPGYDPYVAQFTVAPGAFPIRFRVALSPRSK
jgi:hypothetical protein